MNASKHRVWLDDVRPIEEGFDLHVKHADEAIRLLDANEVAEISLDYDLGIGCPMGIEVAQHIANLAKAGHLPPITVHIHTGSDGGRLLMKLAIHEAREGWKTTAQGSRLCRHVQWMPEGYKVEGQPHPEGWYFFDEVGFIISGGPYKSETEAIDGLNRYAQTGILP